MKNADMPAMPITLAPGEVWDEEKDHADGLTKREYFAALAMQGLIAAWGQHDVTDSREIAGDAVTFAEALLAELDKEAT